MDGVPEFVMVCEEVCVLLGVLVCVPVKLEDAVLLAVVEAVVVGVHVGV